MSEYGAPLAIIRDQVVRPALQIVGLWSEAREQLVLGTGAVESRYKYCVQIGGPALGWFQCEPATHADILTNYVSFRTDKLSTSLRRLCDGFETKHALVAHPMYAAAICGIHYLRVSAALPPAGDFDAMAAYHKRWYNTALGKTDPAESVIHFQRVCQL